jgi:hypothetical protein
MSTHTDTHEVHGHDHSRNHGQEHHHHGIGGHQHALMQATHYSMLKATLPPHMIKEGPSRH